MIKPILFSLFLNFILTGSFSPATKQSSSPKVECQTIDDFLTKLNAKYMTAVAKSHINCSKQTALFKGQKGSTEFSINLWVEVGSCSKSFNINGRNMDIGNCQSECLDQFSNCLESFKIVPLEEPVENLQLHRQELKHFDQSSGEDKILNYSLPSNTEKQSSEHLNNYQLLQSDEEDASQEEKEPLLPQQDTSSVENSRQEELRQPLLGKDFSFAESKTVSESVHKPLHAVKGMMTGGPSACDQGNKKFFKRIVSNSQKQGLLDLPSFYDENVVLCFKQVISGIMFQTVLKIDGKFCRLFIIQNAV